MQNQHLSIESNKYPALLAIIKIFRFLGWLIFVVSIVIGLAGGISMSSGGIVGFLISVLVGFFAGLMCLAIGETLKIFIDIEANTRVAAENLYKSSVDSEI